MCIIQIQQSQTNQFNMHIHVEYEWRLRQDDLYESDDDPEDKVNLIFKKITFPACSKMLTKQVKLIQNLIVRLVLDG